MRLSEFLEAAGYWRIPLQRSEIGHFHAPASLNGRAVSVLLDTGANCTLVSLALARELDLSLSLLPDQGGGAGSAAMDVYMVENASLQLAELPIRPHNLLAMDLGHANDALADKGAGAIEAILGLDVFEQYSAVIDYGSRSLFLRS